MTTSIYIGDCPACRQPARVEEREEFDGHIVIVTTLCSTCDHEDTHVIEITEEGEMNECLA